MLSQNNFDRMKNLKICRRKAPFKILNCVMQLGLGTRNLSWRLFLRFKVTIRMVSKKSRNLKGSNQRKNYKNLLKYDLSEITRDRHLMFHMAVVEVL